MTIRRLRLIAFFGVFILIASSVLVTFWALQMQRTDARIINLAGRQRILIQKMALQVLAVQISDDPLYHDQLRLTESQFERTLEALIAGGPAPYTEDTIITLPPTRDPAILAQLEIVRDIWGEIAQAIRAVLGTAPASSAFEQAVAEVQRLSPDFLDQMDEAVRMYEAAAAQKVQRVQKIQIGFIGAAIALMLIAWFLTERWVLDPISQLRAAARRIGEGDLTTPIDVTGPEEISRLSIRLEAMRTSLAASREALEGWARELDDRVAARTREIATLSAVAQAANHYAEIAPMLDEMLPLLCQVISASAAWVSLLDDRGEFFVGGAYNLPPALEANDRAAMRWTECACQRRLLAGELTEAVNILECTRLQQAPGDTRGLRYHAAVPLRVGERALGVLNITTPAKRLFTQDELRLLSVVSDQVSVAIERARLYERVKERYIEEQATLLLLSQALLSETDTQAILDTTVRVAAQALQVEFAAIALVDEEGLSYSGRAAVGWSPEVLRHAQGIPLSAGTGLGYAIQTAAPVVIPDEDQETRFETPPWVTAAGIRSSVLVPMAVSDRVIGGLVVNSRRARAWSDSEVHLLTLIANDAAQALERARLHEETLRQRDRLQLLHRLDRAISGTLALPELLSQLAEELMTVLEVNRCSIWLLDEGGETLRGRGYGLQAGDPAIEGILLSRSEPMVARVLETRQPLMVADVNDPAYADVINPQYVAAFRIQAFLMAPLVQQDQAIGFLVLDDTRGPRIFQVEDIQLVQSVASEAAIAVEKARLYEQTRQYAERLAVLYETGKDLTTTLELDALLHLIAERATRLTGADRGLILLVDMQKEALTKSVGVGYPRGTVSRLTYQEIMDGISGWVLREKAPTISQDVLSDPRNTGLALERAKREHEQGMSVAVAPLMIKQDVIGTLTVVNLEESPGFSQGNLDLVVMLADQAAVAIENAHLFEQTRRRAEELKVVSEILRALNATPEVTEAFPAIVAGLKVITGCERISLVLLEENEEYATLAALDVARSELAQGVRIRVTDSAAADDLAAGRPHLTPDLSAEADYPAEGILYAAGYRSRINLPLHVNERGIGALNLAWLEPAGYDPDQVQLLGQIADSLALAVERSRLFGAMKHRAEELSALAELSAELRAVQSMDEMIPIFAQKAMEIVDGIAVAIFLVEPSGESLLAPRWYRDDAESMEREDLPPLRHRLGEGITGRVALSGEVYITADLQKDPLARILPGEAAAIEDVTSLISLPLRTRERVVGVMHVGLGEQRAFTDEEVDLLTAIAEMAGNALHRARAHEELEENYLQTVLALANAMDARDAYTGDHSQRLATWAQAVARALACSEEEVQRVYWGALLHDIGKIGVPDEILRKAGPLTDEEWELMKRHPELGAEIVAPVENLVDVAPIIRSHQEKYDGSGYPDGLRGEEIPLGARILAVVDAYGAMTDERVYRKARSPEDAIAELQRCAGEHFDPRVVEAFLAVLEAGIV